MPQIGVVAGGGAGGGRSTRLVGQPAAPPVSARRRLSLLALAGVIWFAVSTAAELYNGGPDVDGPLFVLAVLVTCLIAASLARSVAEDVVVAGGAVGGLVASAMLAAIEPEGHSPSDIAMVSVYLGVAIVLISPVVRRVLGSLRDS